MLDPYADLFAMAGFGDNWVLRHILLGFLAWVGVSG
jgi:hypothetical protein